MSSHDDAGFTLSRTRSWLRRGRFACAAALALALSACGGGGGDSAVGDASPPQVVTSPASTLAVVGQVRFFSFEALGTNLTFDWEEQPNGIGDWRAGTGTISREQQFSSMVMGPVAIGMDKTRLRGRVSNGQGSITTDEALLDVVWGLVSTVEPMDFGLGPGAGSIGGADGGSPGGGDGEGAGVGGGLGKTPRAVISLARVADGASLGSAPAGATSGVVRVKAGPGAAPVVITLRGADDATYFDEGRDAMLPLPATEQLHALVLSFDRHLGVTTLTEAAYRYALNNFLQDPAAVRARTVPLKRTATPEELARLTPVQIQLANEAIRNEINKILPPRYALDSISTLPTPVDNTSPSGSITDNIYGRMQAVVGGLALAASRFEPSLENPALRMNSQLADDLTDGIVDGLSLDQQSVFGAQGSNAYGPGSLPQLLADAADAQFQRFGDGTILQPPLIGSQPSSASITPGGTARLNVTATGTLLAFQWFRDGSAIPGATRDFLETSQAGQYRVEVGNGSGVVSSNTVAVTVVQLAVAPSIAGQPASTSVTSGSTAVFTVQASGTNLSYQWQLVSPVGASDLAGATSSSYSTGTAGTYRVVVTNVAGTATSQDATLTVTPLVIAPQISRQPTSQAVPSGQSATIDVQASGNPLAFQWHNADTGPINGATSSSFTTSASGSYFVVVTNTAGNVRSDTVTVTVFTAPVITTQPASVTITSGQSTTLSVVATGVSLAYQWRRDGADIAGANAPTHTASQAGSYTAVVTNPAGSVTSTAAVVSVVSTPVITAPPAAASINDNQDHTFSVTATGVGLAYQWFRADGDGPATPIAGATAATYTTRAAGSYFVEVSNSAGTVRSPAVQLTVTQSVIAPSITAQPASITINQGQTAQLIVAADGTTLQYQWRRDGTDIAGANSASYAATTSGSYTVVVSNTAGSVTSNAATVTVNAPPAITTQPASTTTINQGQTATLTVVASGPSLSYQWRLAGNPIAGANASTYATGTAGSYTVVVSNPAGSVTSSAATVNVVGVPSITTQPVSPVTINQGQTTNVCVVASGPSLSYQWRLNGTPIAGANASCYAASTGGTYTVVVSNPAGAVASNPVTVNVIEPPVITTQPASVTINQGQTATLNVVATGSSLSYQWRVNGAPIGGATAASYTATTNGSYTVVVSNAAGSVTSTAATVSVIPPPAITTQPASVTINQGQTATLTVVASGPSLSYQWRLAGNPIAGANASTYATGTAGNYTVVVSNPAGSVTSSAATVNVVGVPSITTQPVSPVTINQGQTTNVCVVASGPSLSYQWRLNGTPIAGANASCYAASTGGAYTVVVSNPAGSVTSNAATVTVIVPPTITTQPASVTINAGQTATLTAVAAGTAPLSYQWRNANGNIAGANSASYATGVAGPYTLVVTNAAGSATSNPATVTVTVIPPPVITTQPVAATTINPGQVTTLLVVATGSSPLTYQWRNNGVAIPNATSSAYTTGSAGNYTVVVTNTGGSVTSAIANVTVAVLPTVTVTPATVTILQGQSATLQAAVTGTAPFTYQWFFNGSPISNATGPSLTVTTLGAANVSGTYTVEVTNRVGPVRASSIVTVIAAPTVAVQPATVTITQGQLTTLQSVVQGTGPFTYQWSNANGSMPNQTGASLTTGAAGVYTVAVTNAVTTTSASATVNVIVPPTITTQPASASIPKGATHTFTVVATGTDLQYQWRQVPAGAGPIDIPGATSSTYTTGTPGAYMVIVRNKANEVPSTTATLEIASSPNCSIPLPSPKISTGPVSSGRVSLPVANSADYADALFAASPNLPACGLNDSASRTWVDIKDGKSGAYIYGFCALGSGADLQSIWVPQSSGAGSVYIELVDRACGRTVRSNTVSLPVVID